MGPNPAEDDDPFVMFKSSHQAPPNTCTVSVPGVTQKTHQALRKLESKWCVFYLSSICTRQRKGVVQTQGECSSSVLTTAWWPVTWPGRRSRLLPPPSQPELLPNSSGERWPTSRSRSLRPTPASQGPVGVCASQRPCSSASQLRLRHITCEVLKCRFMGCSPDSNLQVGAEPKNLHF